MCHHHHGCTSGDCSRNIEFVGLLLFLVLCKKGRSFAGEYSMLLLLKVRQWLPAQRRQRTAFNVQSCANSHGRATPGNKINNFHSSPNENNRMAQAQVRCHTNSRHKLDRMGSFGDVLLMWADCLKDPECGVTKMLQNGT